MAKIDHHTLRRRGFDLHIAALLKLRRAHGHSSFFDERGYIRVSVRPTTGLTEPASGRPFLN